jgi:hypothetical protein
MRTSTREIVVALLTVGLCRFAAGQESINFSTMRGAPFQAERITTDTFANADGSTGIRVVVKEKIARDSLGRVRIARRAGSSDEQILIHDPTEQRIAFLISSAKAARVERDRTQPKQQEACTKESRCTFCERFDPRRHGKMPPDSAFEELGDKTIDGLPIHGFRIARPTRIDETWCSEELSVVMIHAVRDPRDGTETKIEIRDVKRGESDAVLFRIPDDYTINPPNFGNGMPKIVSPKSSE